MARSDRKRVLGLALVIAAVPLVVACNAIIGLSDFEKTECNGGGKCSDGGVPPIDGDIPDRQIDGDVPDVRGAAPVSWAAWPMPNYDGGAEFLPHPIKYEIVDANRIKDSVTGLLWRRATLPAATYDSAKAACTGLDPATGPWRLPKRIELVTLLDFSQTRGVLIGKDFTGVANVKVWSSSEYRTVDTKQASAPVIVTDQYWIVDFESGKVDTLSSAGGLVAAVLCVGSK